ncbi:FAD-dependent oxidoreductase [sulfur-oxidizing endosymbiont of Gigantopelta aegis]|uniref:FAD-dependent oxidoreductase n=1 Tax=sulfur-oxidizing endosymbiont of Gigantopelta aegis TaxID=2794934 RepID=UPI0018DCAE13|nr:FAD-dependent oxidoreductase [sulfur-oxidizing endosymbiont of Gigantopelta aegis]
MNKARQTEAVDIAIIGGGIAGLWTLARLRHSGYQAFLLEADQLGGVQSNASQGIIHGGTKYALTGKLTHSSQAIQQMPKRWQDCLNGQGEVDLSQARVLSEHQFLWSNKSLATKITGFFASKVMSSRMKKLPIDDFVAPFNQKNFKGDLYQLDEPVLDIQSVIDTLRKQYSEVIFQADIQGLARISTAQKSNDDHVYNIALSYENDASKKLLAKVVVLTSGSGNECLLSSLKQSQPEMQRRPLYMPMLKASENILPKMYAHCLGASALPKMTITSHTLDVQETNAKQTVWYLGGEIAEQGVGRSLEEQVNIAKKELASLMPWMDFSTCQWSALAIDRAEPKMPDGSRPVEPWVSYEQDIISAWPVKLAMAPVMVDKIILQLEALAIDKNSSARASEASLLDLPKAKTSPLPWEKVQHWI